MPIPDSLEPASLDAFISSLLAAGFDPVGDQRSWVGPLHPALEHLTDERTMRVEVRDGWPYLHPKVYVQGLAPGLHRNYHGDICLWDDGDPSLDWLTWDGIARRIEEWAAEAPATATADDPALDAHLYFEGGSKGLATIDLSGVKVRDWEARGVRGTQKDGLLEIGNGPLHGRLYTRSAIKTPPRDLAAVRHLLRRRQQRDFDEAISSVGSPDGVSFLILAWNTEIGPNLLVLWLERANGALKATSFEAARTDCEVLLLRAGPDRSQLAQRTVAILGLGAVGSQLALLLARSGVGTLAVFDPQRLRPADVVRHAASSLFVGRSKVAAMKSAVLLQAPWTKVLAADRSHWEPSQLAEIARNVDLVVDAVGSASFTVQLARVCEAEARRLLSVSFSATGMSRGSDIRPHRRSRIWPTARQTRDSRQFLLTLARQRSLGRPGAARPSHRLRRLPLHQQLRRPPVWPSRCFAGVRPAISILSRSTGRLRIRRSMSLAAESSGRDDGTPSSRRI